MKMDGDIRVRTDNRFGRIYTDLKNNLDVEYHEVFFSCACLAYSRKKHKSLGRQGGDRFWSKTITPLEWNCYYSMLLAENNFDFHVIQEDKNVISRVEEFANLGMEILIDEFLHDYLLKKSDEPQLDPSCSKDLSKELLHFLFNQSEDGTVA